MSVAQVNIGAQIKQAQRDAHVTTEELARRVGVTLRTATRWRADATAPSYERLALVAQALDKPLAYFLTGDGNGPKAAPLRPESDGHAALSDSDRSGPPSLGNAELPQSREARSTT